MGHPEKRLILYLCKLELFVTLPDNADTPRGNENGQCAANLVMAISIVLFFFLRLISQIKHSSETRILLAL